MFEHLRFNGAAVEARSSAGRVALEMLDLNDPESLQFREFILSTIDLYEEKRAALVQKRDSAAKRVKAGTMTAAVAAQATAEIDNSIATVDVFLNKLAGRPR